MEFTYFDECIFRLQVIIKASLIKDNGTVCLSFLIVIFQVFLI